MPEADKPEYVFCGRSNVGKSSLINALVGKPGLAKTSGQPGKTREINHFLVDREWYLCDMPGYGYAKVSQKQREEFRLMMNSYLLGRANLMCVMALIDARHEPQESDLAFLDFLGRNGIPFAMVFTKCDKNTRNENTRIQAAYQKKILQSWEELPPWFQTSAETGVGLPELLNWIQDCNTQFTPPDSKA